MGRCGMRIRSAHARRLTTPLPSVTIMRRSNGDGNTSLRDQNVVATLDDESVHGVSALCPARPSAKTKSSVAANGEPR